MNQETDASSNFLNSSAEAISGLTAPSQAIDHSSGSSASRDPQMGLPLLAPVANRETQQPAPSIAPPTEPDLIDLPSLEPTAPMDPTWGAISSLTGNYSEGLDNIASTDLNLEGFTGGHGDEDFQETNPNFQTPTWQTNMDFELNAFHRFTADTSFGWPLDDLVLPQLGQVDVPSKSPQNVASHREDTVRQHWFTFRPPRRSNAAMQYAEGEGNKVDETYRTSLSQKLLLRVPHEALPSAEFLVYIPQPLVHSAARLTAIEPLHSNVLYPLQSDLPSHPQADVSTVSRKLATTLVNMLYRELVP